MDQDEYKVFLQLIEKELNYLSVFDLATEEWLLAGAGALVVLRDYVNKQLQDEDQFKPLEF